MKIIATLLATIALLCMGVPPAQADPIPIARLPHASLCVSPDFPVVGSGWALQGAVRMWDEAQDIVQITASATAARTTDCMVAVVSRTYIKDGSWCGAAQINGVLLPEGNIATAVHITLNDWCLRNGAARSYGRMIAAHEIGHAMGLDHSTSTRSVMQTSAPGYLAQINPVDVRALASVYQGS